MNRYQPKGSMCAVCTYRLSHQCATLKFQDMPVIKVYSDGTKAVKCVKFEHKGEG